MSFLGFIIMLLMAATVGSARFACVPGVLARQGAYR